ncbi:hypothetical protein BDZ85DRAFT_17831 [Elsinoe ampelina]|uniref:Uncharacterized protein n=1 Tax=Elsinoe ampelina TaxID=302913 RepID=A0A6A6G7E5_9PEZI|nr:hypothetical protein BDZ85DRAFT_17831 [Elsinoe ampelina]
MNASAGREVEGGSIPRRPVGGAQGGQGRHLASSNTPSSAASTFASRARARSQSRSQERGRGRGVLAGTAVAPAPLPLGAPTASASAPGSRAGSVTAGQGRGRGGSTAGDEGRERVYPISGEGVILSNVTPPRTPRVGEGLDLPARGAEFDSAPPTPRGYEAEPVPNYVYGAEYNAAEVESRLARDAQRIEELAEARRSFVPMDEPGSWSANRTEPLPRVTPRASRPVMRKVEKTEEEKEEGVQQQGLRREGSLGRFGKKVLGVVKKAPRSRAGSLAGSRPGSPHSQRKEEKVGPQRSGSLVDKALDFFAPDRHELAAAGKGQGFKGRMRIKAGLPVSAGPTTPKLEAVEKKDSLDSGTSEPQDEEIWGFSRRMSSRLEAMEKEAEAARMRDEEYQARQTELNRQRAMAMLSGEDATEVRPGTSDSRVTTFSQFINARDSMESVKPPAPLKVVKEKERDPREIWNEINRAQGRQTSESPELHPANARPAPEQTTAPVTKDKGKDKDTSGMFGMSYIHFAEFQKVAAKMHMPWEEKKQPRGFSCGSDMSFADCGAPDMMEECTSCGLVPTGAHFLRNGLCAKCR